MRVERLGACRGEGKAFIKLRISGISHEAALVVNAQGRGVGVPAALYPLQAQKEGSEHARVRLFVLELPFLKIPALTVGVKASTGESTQETRFKINCELLKWQSRLNYRMRKTLCVELRDNTQRAGGKHLTMGGLRYLESNEGTIWRFFVEWRGVQDARIMVRAQDLIGQALPLETFLFEEQTLTEGESRQPPGKRIFLSVQLGKGVSSCILEVRDELDTYQAAFCCIDDGGFEQLKYDTWKLMRDARADDANYQRWLKQHAVNEEELKLQREASANCLCLVSIVVPCYQSHEVHLKEMLWSVLNQSYQKWELLLMDASPESGVAKQLAETANDERVRYYNLGKNEGIVANTSRGIEQAKGEFVAFLDHDDLLEPNALYAYIEAIKKNPEVELLFCDEDLFSVVGEYRQPIFKTQLNLDLLYSHNCITHFLMVRTACLRRIGFSVPEVSGAQDYDLALRVVEAGGKAVHIPQVLYHWREHAGSTSGDNIQSKPYAEEAGRRALEAHLERRGLHATVATTAHPCVYRVNYPLPSPHPEVCIIIPSKDHTEILDACIQSIAQKSTYDNYRILVIENNSELARTFAYYETLQKKLPFVRVVTWEHEFNYPKIINFGVEQTTSDYVLLLNNDTQVISSNFIEEMLGYLQRPEVGLVGAKLYFRDGLVQHAGMLIGPHGAVAHVNQDFSSTREGYLSRAVRPGNYSAVTGACQMTKRSVFNEVGGYNERLAVGFNDVDFCLRIWKAGYRVVFTPFAELYHYEFTTRGRETVGTAKETRWKEERELFERTWPEYFEAGDPYSNPNLDCNSIYYALPRIGQER